MAQIELTDSELIVHMEGNEHTFLFLWGKQITVPLQHVEGADVNPAVGKDWLHRFKLFGTGFPGRGTFGIYLDTPEAGETGLTLFDVAHPDNAIVIRLNHEKYKSMVIAVDDPQVTVNAINEAVARMGARSSA